MNRMNPNRRSLARRDPTSVARSAEEHARRESTYAAYAIAADAWLEAGDVARAKRMMRLWSADIGRVWAAMLKNQAASSTDREYEDREWRSYRADVQNIERVPPSEARAAAKDFTEAMRSDPEHVAEQIGWIIDGNYGRGAQQVAERTLAASGATNKPAQLSQIVGILNWRVPPRRIAAAWKALTPNEQIRLDQAIRQEIDDATREVRTSRDPRRGRASRPVRRRR